MHRPNRKESCKVTDTVHEPRNTYMYDQTTSVELSHILHVVQKSVEFSGVYHIFIFTKHVKKHINKHVKGENSQKPKEARKGLSPNHLCWFVSPLDHYKHVLTAPARCSQYKISRVHVLGDYIIAEVDGL